jgi:putative FmdB family regulatory protein
MPFYEYECPKCGHHEEVLQAIGEKPLTKCPSCKKNGLKKLVSAPVFRLKGSGWYETDFKSDKDNKRNLAGADKEEPKAEAKTDTKAEATPEAAKSDSAKADVEKPKAKPVASKAQPTRKSKPKSKSRKR